jgi:hypothetical protein
MRILLSTIVALSLTAPTIALEPMPADGDWDCDLGIEKLGGINIDGESYRFTRPDGRKRAGDLALELNDVTYYIETGVLREEFGLNQIEYVDEGGADDLILSSGDFAAPTPVGGCVRVKP